MRYKNFMKKRMLSLLLTIVLLTTAYMPAYAESSKMLHDSFSSNEVKETGINIENLMIIEDNSVQEQRNVLEEELVPVASTNCVQNKVYARYAGYYCSYIPSAYYRYRLQHPDGYTIDISDPNMFYIGQNYMELVVAMENAEDNAEALTRMLGFGVTVAMVLASHGFSIYVLDSLDAGTFISMALAVLDEQIGLSDQIKEEILEVLLPDFCDLQVLMQQADDLFYSYWDGLHGSSDCKLVLC